MSGKKLLVADDSLTIQKVIRLALSNEGYEIQTVSDGNDAIQQIALFRPDAVLIDVSLPGKSAFEVKREINSQSDLEEIRFVLMSSAFEKVDEIQTKEVIFHGRLTKPFDPAHLRQVLTDVLAQVTAKRMEKTTLLTRPSLEPPTVPPPQPENLTIFPPFAENPIAPPPPLDELLGNNATLMTPPPPISENPTEWATTLKPEEFPTLPDEPLEPLKDLWDSAPGSPPSSPSPPSTEEDIRELTESTMRISQTDDFQWSVKEPSIKPLPSMSDKGGASFSLDPPNLQLQNPSTEGSKTPSEKTQIFDDAHEVPFQPSSELPLNFPEPPPLSPNFTPSANASPPLSGEQIESLIAKQVEAALEKLAQNLIPEIAERLIKQEIHRMLSE